MVEDEVEEELLDFLGLLQLLAVVVDDDNVLELPAAATAAADEDALVLLEPTRRSRDLLRIIGLALYGCR